MSEDRRDNTDEDRGERSWWEMFTGHLPLEAETAMFILVNMIDYFMTYLLLTSGLFRESNPIAEFVINHWGPLKGMLYFKVGLVTFVCVVAQVVALKKVKTARWVLNLGTVVVSVVVIYSFTLYLRETL